MEHRIVALSPSLATDQAANRGDGKAPSTRSCARIEITMWYGRQRDSNGNERTTAPERREFQLETSSLQHIVNPGSWSRDSQPELRRGSRGRPANWRWSRPHPTRVHESLGQSGDVVVQ